VRRKGAFGEKNRAPGVRKKGVPATRPIGRRYSIAGGQRAAQRKKEGELVGGKEEEADPLVEERGKREDTKNALSLQKKKKRKVLPHQLPRQLLSSPGEQLTREREERASGDEEKKLSSDLLGMRSP